MGVGGWGCPNSCRMRQMSASAAEAATRQRMAQMERIGQFKKIGRLSFGSVPRKKCPPI